MIGLGTAINIGLIIAGSLCGLAFWSLYERKFKANAHDCERYYRAPPRYERGHAVYARHCQWISTNNGPAVDDY